MNKEGSVRLRNSAIAESPRGDIVFRGVLDPDSLQLIRVDTYQREVLPLSQVSTLVEAIRSGEQIPDIAIGMRGSSYQERGDMTYLQDDVYVIDGLQRISVAMELMRRGEQPNPHIGTTVYFNTDREFENRLFTILNTRQKSLSSSVLIRNLRTENQAVGMLYDLCFDRSFAMADRVCWDQQMKRGHLMTSLGLVKVTGQLHAGFGPGLSTHWDEACEGINKTMRDVVTRKIMRDNVRLFFEAMDEAWGIRTVTMKAGAAHLKNTFLIAMCRVLSNHRNFWDDNRHLVIDSQTRKKLRTFPINNPDIQRLASAGSTAAGMLYFEIVTHLNKSKKLHHLVPFKEVDDVTAGSGRRHGTRFIKKEKPVEKEESLSAAND